MIDTLASDGMATRMPDPEASKIIRAERAASS
jgi:hypothetical protein